MSRPVRRYDNRGRVRVRLLSSYTYMLGRCDVARRAERDSGTVTQLRRRQCFDAATSQQLPSYLRQSLQSALPAMLMLLDPIQSK